MNFKSLRGLKERSNPAPKARMHSMLDCRAHIRSLAMTVNKITPWLISIFAHALIITAIIISTTPTPTRLATAPLRPIVSAYVVSPAHHTQPVAQQALQPQPAKSIARQSKPASTQHLPQLNQQQLRRLLQQLAQLIGQQLPANTIHGRVTLRFELTPDGQIQQLTIVRSSNPQLAQVARRAVQQLNPAALAPLTDSLYRTISIEAPFVFQ